MNINLIVKSTIAFIFLFISLSVYAQTNTVPQEDIMPISSQSASDDMAITNGIKSQINKSLSLSRLNIGVETKDGAVTLSGTVNSASQASILIELAESTIGVTSVDASKLKVRGGSQPFTDTYITAKVKGLLIREQLFGEKDVAGFHTSIETKDGVVYITGTINDQVQINNAIEIIKRGVPEVKAVEYHVRKSVPLTKVE